MKNLHYLVNEAILSADQKKEKNVYDSEEEDPEMAKKQSESPFCGILPLNKDNEMQAWMLFQCSCYSVLNAYPTTLAEDTETLESKD